jgi:acyl dehydratase
MVISAAQVQRYIAALDVNDNEWYSGDSPYGGPISPAALLVYEPMSFPGPRQYRTDAQPFTTGVEWSFISPLHVGQVVKLRQRVSDRWIKREREHVIFEMEVLDSDGGIATLLKYKESWANPPLYDPPLPNRDGERYLRPEGTGDILGELSRQLTFEMSRAFCGLEVNFHTDRALAQARGYPDVVIAGPQIICLISELATRVFGAGYFKGGKLSVNLLRPVLAGEALVVKAARHREVADAGRKRLEAVIWCENGAGEKVAAGLASSFVQVTGTL